MPVADSSKTQKPTAAATPAVQPHPYVKPAEPAKPAPEPVHHDAPVHHRVHTEAQRAGMTQARWDALSDDEKAAARVRLADPSYRTDAQRAGLTQTQWNAFSAAEQAEMREKYPDTTPKAEMITTQSPSDSRGVIGAQGRSPSWEQPAVAPVPTKEERIAAASLDPNEPNPDDSLEHLPNAPGGRNNPTMTDYDPSRNPTE